MTPKVSVIIPNYNHALYLHQRIDSVLNQSLQPYEIIILDDCSTDNSIEIIESYIFKFPGIKFIQNAFNSGSTFAQWNKGVSIAKGDLIWIAESDDVAEPTFLATMVGAFNFEQTLSLAFSQSSRMNEEGSIVGTWLNHTDEFDTELFKNNFLMNGIEFIEKFLIHKNCIPNASAVVFKKNIYLNVGSTELPLKMLGDWLVWIKILTCGKVAFFAKELNSFRFHSQSAIAKSVEMKNFYNYYDELYAYSMRKCLMKEIHKKKLFFSKLIICENRKYYNLELLNMSMYYIQKRQFIKGWKLIIIISFTSVFSIRVIKRALSSTINSIKPIYNQFK